MKLSSRCRDQQREHVLVCNEVARVAPAGKAEQRPLVADTAGVIDQMSDRDCLPEVRQFRHVLPDLVVQCQLAVLREQQDRSGRELFRHRRDVEDGGRREAHVVVEIRHAVGAAQHGPAVLIDSHGAAWRAGDGKFLEDLIDARLAILWRRLRERQPDDGYGEKM